MKSISKWLPFRFYHHHIRSQWIKAHPELHEDYLQLRKKNASIDELSFKGFVDRKCIFIHIPKCAGVSVCKSLFGNLAGDHHNIYSYLMAFSPAEFKNFYKFTFVRNPWDRLVSAYLFLKQGGLNEGDKSWYEANLAQYCDFEDFVLNWVTPENVRSWKHFVPQHEYVYFNNRLLVDFVGYFEKIDQDFATICERMNLPLKLLKTNKTVNRKKDYKSYYTEATRDRVARVYTKDIERFGYCFSGEFDNSENSNAR